jgi:hypothetical protein
MGENQFNIQGKAIQGKTLAQTRNTIERAVNE